MTVTRMVLSEAAVKALPPAFKGQYLVKDEKLKGFYVLVGARTRRYMVQGDLRIDRKATTIKVSVGDATEMTTAAARAIAKGYLAEISKGRHPKPDAVRKRSVSAKRLGLAPESSPPPAQTDFTEEDIEAKPITAGITLREAWLRYKISHLIRKNRSPKTIEGYEHDVLHVFTDWLDKPLSELADNPDLVATKHDELTVSSGPYGANGAMRTLRAIDNYAWRKNKRALPPENPVDAVDWNPEHRRNTAMGLKDLPGWFKEAAKLENPIRREFHLFTLLSGSRTTALKLAMLKHLDLRRRVLHIAAPKGGEIRAFDIPLSRQMILCLLRAIRFGRLLHPDQAATWLFPANSEAGHMVETKEDREDLSKWGNDLRQTFRTLATHARISEIDAKLLMNHAIAGVNSGYITREKIVEDFLRGQQQAISNVMFGTIVEEASKPGILHNWLGLGTARRTVIASLFEAPEAEGSTLRKAA